MENVTISTNKGGNLAKLVDLQVLWADTGGAGGIGLDNLKLNVVCLRNCADGS